MNIKFLILLTFGCLLFLCKVEAARRRSNAPDDLQRRQDEVDRVNKMVSRTKTGSAIILWVFALLLLTKLLAV